MSIEEILNEISMLFSDEKERIIDKIIGTALYKELPDIKNIREELHESSPIECPYCKSRNWIKFGFYRGLQKYRCSECTRTFIAITGSSAYRILSCISH